MRVPRMSRWSLAAALALLAPILLCVLSTAAFAQAVSPMVRNHVDGNNVDLISGQVIVEVPLVSIGDPASDGLALIQSNIGATIRDNFDGGVATYSTATGGAAQVTIGGSAETFHLDSGSIVNFISDQGSGATLSGSLTYGFV